MTVTNDKALQYAARQMYRQDYVITFDIAEIQAVCARWGVEEDCCYLSMKNNILYMHFCIEGDDITQEMLQSFCMDYRPMTDDEGRDISPLPDYKETYDLIEEGVSVDVMYEMRYIIMA